MNKFSSESAIMYSNRQFAFDNVVSTGSLYEDLFDRYYGGASSSSESVLTHLSHSFSWLFHSIKPRVVRNISNVAKRGLDIAACGLGLTLLSPIFLVIALCIKATDGGPILFWQKRVGLHGTVFNFPKFRSMVTNAEELKKKLMAQNQHGEGVTFKMKCDPRITGIGRIIRRFSLDELPQLWCVLTGEMSLVGPRPAVTQEVARYTMQDRVRLRALPGLTCIWQVSGRSELSFDKQVKLDEQYVLRRNFFFDLSLLAKTLPAVISGKGAY
jgi:lipopolysaccharide/colanic/teichoic acid biosynthesis glycosyltransferase